MVRCLWRRVGLAASEKTLFRSMVLRGVVSQSKLRYSLDSERPARGTNSSFADVRVRSLKALRSLSAWAFYRVRRGSYVSLFVFLTLYFLYFLSLWLSWVLAVWVTKPKTVRQGA